MGENRSLNKKRIALLAGGWSLEREVSLESGNAVFAALDKEMYDVCRYDPRTELQALAGDKEHIDLALILLHGKYGEDGRIQGLLDILDIPYMGSGVLSSAISLNKKVAKEIYVHAGLNVARDVTVNRDDGFSIEETWEALGPATVVKPVSEGSSLGMSVCRTIEEFVEGIHGAFRYDRDVLIEECIDGREITCCVLGNRDIETLPLVEIVPGDEHGFFDYKAKYTPGGAREICPAHISPVLAGQVRAYAKLAHQALRCSVWSRTDMIIRDESVYVLETNTIPGMTENSLFPLAARTAGLSLSALLNRLISLSLETR